MNEEEINKLIGSRIILFRESRKMTRTSLARALNISQQQLDKYEKGVNRISAAKLAIISEIFEVNILYFYEKITINLGKANIDIENLNKLISYYLNTKKLENKELIILLAKELSKIY